MTMHGAVAGQQVVVRWYVYASCAVRVRRVETFVETDRPYARVHVSVDIVHEQVHVLLQLFIR